MQCTVLNFKNRNPKQSFKQKHNLETLKTEIKCRTLKKQKYISETIRTEIQSRDLKKRSTIQQPSEKKYNAQILRKGKQ